MKTFSFFLAFALLAVACPLFSEAAIVPGTTFVNPSSGNTYFVLEPATWLDAQAEAVLLGGNLVTINDAVENQWIVDTYASLPQIPWENPNGQTLWIGLNDIDVEGQFEWVSGEPFSYDNWGPGEPNNLLGVEDYGQIWTVAGSAPASSWEAGDWNDGGTNLDPGMLELVAGPGLVEIVIPEPTSLALLTLSAAVAFCRRD